MRSRKQFQAEIECARDDNIPEIDGGEDTAAEYIPFSQFYSPTSPDIGTYRVPPAQPRR